MVELHCTLTPLGAHSTHTLCYCGVSLTPQVTRGHSWQVHLRRQGADGDCSTVGGHFDPFLADVDKSGYDEECGPNAQLRCEMGDLSGKHGSLTIGGMATPRMVFVGYDVNLHLAGPYNGELTNICIINLPSYVP